jgi:D-arginine dehydrogenase
MAADVPSDFLVLGGGMAGACAGYFLADRGRVTVLEMEDGLGYHSTGRSAALFSEYYGNRCVRGLTAAARPFFDAPPEGFAEHPLLTPRGVLALAPPGAEARFEAVLADGRECASGVRELGPGEVRELCPVVRPGWYARAMHKPGAMDIDVDGLHQGFVRGIRAKGGRVLTRSAVRSLARRGGLWRASTEAGEFAAPVVVNAAGAWADALAGPAGVLPLGLVPKRRTAAIVPPPPGLDVTAWPLVCDVTETFYFKPEAGGLMICPVDATPAEPHDVRHDDLDVAIAAARFEEVTTLTVRRVSHQWAGLRTFARDDTPAVGPAPDAPGFFWLAGLGGFGIQIAPSVGRAVAALASGEPWPDDLSRRGIAPEALAPARLLGALA